MTLDRELLLLALAVLVAMCGGVFSMVRRALVELRARVSANESAIAVLQARLERGQDDGK